jgi:hypothetical protein
MAMRLERHVVDDARNDVEGQRDACAFIPTARLSHRQVDGFVASGHTFRVEALYFFGGWMFGLVWIGILSALRDPDERWQLRNKESLLCARGRGHVGSDCCDRRVEQRSALVREL